MDTSFFLANIIGFYFVIVGIAGIIRPKMLEEMLEGVENNPALMTFMGIITLILGMIMIQLHNQWNSSWTTVITIVAWVTFIKGILLLWAPRFLLEFSKDMNKKFSNRDLLLIVIFFGAYLIYKGMGA